MAEIPVVCRFPGGDCIALILMKNKRSLSMAVDSYGDILHYSCFTSRSGCVRSQKSRGLKLFQIQIDGDRLQRMFARMEAYPVAGVFLRHRHITALGPTSLQAISGST